MSRPPSIEKMRDTYDAVSGYYEAHGYMPTLREIAGILGLSTASAVYQRLARLAEDGCIVVEYRRPRTIKLIRRP